MATPADAISNVLSQTPPVTRFFAGVTFLVSLAVHVFKIISPYKIIWHSSFIMRMPPQLWRLFTPFYLTTPGLGILFDTFMIYNYGKDLEGMHFNSSGEFLFYLIFNGIIIILLNTFLLGGTTFCQIMGVALAYSWSQRSRGQNVRFFWVTIKAQWMPYAIIAITALQSPEAAYLLTSGLVSAHAYEFLTVIWPRYAGGTNILQTPSWLKWSFEGGPGTRTGGTGGARAYGTGFDPRARDAPAPAPSRGMFSGSGAGAGRTTATPNSATAAAWRNRGSGHRLGSD